MKRVLCLILAAAIVFGFTPMIGLETFAATNNQEFAYDSLTKAATNTVAITLPEFYAGNELFWDDEITVEGGTAFWDMQWMEADGSSFMGSQFRADTYCAFSVTLLAPEGAPYSSDNLTITVNRPWYETSVEYGENRESIKLTVKVYVEKHPDTAGPMNVLLTMPSADPGTVIPAVPEVVADTRDVTCRAAWVNQYPEGTVFVEGQRYPLNIWVERTDGNPFDTEKTEIWPRGSFSFSSGYTNGNRTFYIRDIKLTSQLLSAGPIYLCNLPESIAPGAANVPDVGVKEGMVDITGVRWVDADRQPVTTLEDGKLYYLAVAMQAQPGYSITENIAVSQDTYGVYFDGVEITDNRHCTAYYRYSLLRVAESINVTINQAQKGMAFADLTATVEGNGVLDSIRVKDPMTNEAVEETEFADGKTYAIWYTITPAEGWEFSERETAVEVNGDNWNANSSIGVEKISFCVYFSTCTPITQVELTLSPEVVPGVAIEDVTLNADADAPFVVMGGYFSDASEGESGDPEHFVADREYVMEYELQPKAGYVFAEDAVVTINGKEASAMSEAGGMYMRGWESFAFYIREVYLYDLPYAVTPGEAPEVDPYIEDSKLSVVQIQWVDANKQSVTTLKENNIYYCAITLESTDSRNFDTQPVLFVDNEELNCEFEKISDKKGTFYIPYSLEPGTGDITVTSSGLKQNADIEALNAAVKGNAYLGGITVFEQVYSEDDQRYHPVEVTEGKLKPGTNYVIEYRLVAKDGYRFAGDFTVTVDGGKQKHWNSGSKEITVQQIFTTCTQISDVAVTLPEVEVGKDFSQLTPTASADAPYFVTYNWQDITQEETAVSDKVEKGHAYRINMVLIPKAGYVFAIGDSMTLNGEKIESYTDELGLRLEGSLEFSFLEQITKVELPAMPESIVKGQTLPENFTVSDAENYTMHFSWWYKTGGDSSVEKAEENGVYGLEFYVQPRAGYEFSQDVEIYLGGVLFDSSHTTKESSSLTVYGFYNVGLTEIDKIELTIPRLTAGAVPSLSSISVPAGAKYTVVENAWMQGTDESVFRAEVVSELRGGRYTFMGMIVLLHDGYALSEDVTYFVNGKQVEIAFEQNSLAYTMTYLSLGKLSTAAYKLATPKLSKEGTTICWDEVEEATGYEIYRSTSRSGKYTLVKTVVGTSFRDTVEAGKTYYYKVKAVCDYDSGRNSALSSYISVAYKCEEPVISVTSGESGKPYITWEKVPGAKKYTIYRATSATGKYSKRGTASKPYYTDTSASVGKTYYYKIVANGSSSAYTSGFSNSVSCSVICGTPVVTVKIDSASGRPTLSWKKISGAAKYVIYRQLPGEEGFTLMSTQTGVTYADKTAPGDTECKYYIQVLGKTEAVNGKPTDVIIAITGIAKPSVTGKNHTVSGKPVVSWNAIDGATKYEIYRSTKSTKGYELLTTTEDTSYTDESVSIGKTYYYKVKTVGKVSKSQDSSCVKITGKCATPTAESAFNENSGRPVITWELIDGAKSYTVYRATSVNGRYTKLGTSKTGSYTDTKAKPGNVYFYKVVACGSSSKSNSGYSNITSCSVFCATASVTVTHNASGVPVISWKKVTGAVKYKVMYMDVTDYTGSASGPYADFEAHHLEAYTTKTTFTLPDTQPNRLYMICVVAVTKNESFSSQPSEAEFVYAACAAPKLKGGLTPDGKPYGQWEAVEGATGYAVYRSTKKSSGYQLTDLATDGNMFFDESAVKGKTYYYKVVAVGVAGTESAMSNYIKVKSK